MLVDRSDMGKLALTGAGAKEFLTGQVTNDIVGLGPGTGCYAALLTPKGKMEGDLRVLDTGDELLLLTERVALQALFDRVRRFKIGFDVEVHKRTLESGLLSLVGDDAGLVDPPAEEHDNRTAEIGGAAVLVVATDLGADVICDAADTRRVHAALVAAGAQPADESAAEVIRVESGRPRYGIDLDESVIPQEAGLNERAVSFTKGCYVGQETVARLFYKGKPNRHLRGLRLSGAASTGDPLLLGDKQVGRVGSVADSPRLGPVALAIVRREAEPGATLSVGSGEVSATLVELPFA